MNEFVKGSVPVAVAARVYGKDASWVRAGIVAGWQLLMELNKIHG